MSKERKLQSHIGRHMTRKTRRLTKSAVTRSNVTIPGLVKGTTDVTKARVIFCEDDGKTEYLYIRIAYPRHVAISAVENTELTLITENGVTFVSSEDKNGLNFDSKTLEDGNVAYTVKGNFLNESYLVTIGTQKCVIAGGIGRNLDKTSYSMITGNMPDADVIRDVEIADSEDNVETLLVERRIMQEAYPGNVEYYGEPGKLDYGWTYITYRVVGDCTSLSLSDTSSVTVDYELGGQLYDLQVDLSISHPTMKVGTITYVMIVKLAQTVTIPYKVNFEELEKIKPTGALPAVWEEALQYKAQILKAFDGYVGALKKKEDGSVDGDHYASAVEGGGNITINIGTTVMEIMQNIIAYGEAGGENSIFKGTTNLEDLNTYLESLDGLNETILETYGGEGWEYVTVPYNPICPVGSVGAADYAIGTINNDITWFFLTSAGNHKWE